MTRSSEPLLRTRRREAPSRTRLALRDHGVGDGYADVITDDDDLAAGDQPVVGVNSGIVVDRRLELDNGAASHLQELMDRHRGLSQHHGKFDRDALDRFVYRPHWSVSIAAARRNARWRQRPIGIEDGWIASSG